MLSFKAPIYKIYLYFVIVLFSGSILSMAGVYAKVAKIIGNDFLPTENLNPQTRSIYFLPGDDDKKYVTHSQTCFALDDSTQFFGVSDEEVDRYSWNFGTGNPADTSDQRNPYFFYKSPGKYTVTLNYYKGGQLFTRIDTFTISPDVTAPALGKDTTICPEQFPWDLNPYANGSGPGGAKYVWSNGDTTETSQADSAGVYWVAVTVNGCTRVDEIEVKEYAKPRKRAAIWYFGNNAGIDFNSSPPKPLNDAPLLNAPEGTSAISDINGELIFYTDGQTIYNRDHEVMDNGDNVGGSQNSTQSSLIIPWPGRMPYYYVFTTEDVSSTDKKLMVSLVDMKGGENANGSVVYKNNVLDQNVSERMTAFALKNSQGKDSIYWLVTQEYGTGTFNVYQIDSTGIKQPPSTYNVGKPQSGDNEAQGSIKISSTGKYIAVAAGDRLELYNFNDTTGVISDSVIINLDGTGPAYGVEFSPDGSKLYVSNKSGVYQYEITDSLGTRLPNDSIRSDKNRYQVASGSNFGALQLAPDNKIYIAVDGSQTIKVIQNPDEKGAGSGLGDFTLAGTCTLGLPNFVQSFLEPPQGPGLGYEDACGPGPINLFASGWGDRDFFEWTVDGTTQPKQKMLTQITQNLSLGAHKVSVRITNDCQMDTTLFLDFTIVGGPKPVKLPEDFTMCEGDVEVLDAGPIDETTETYLWSNGATTRTISVNQPGIYSVFVTKDNGCFETDQIVISNPAFGDISGDTLLCQGQTSRLTTPSPYLAHVWKKNGTPLSTNSYVDVNSSGVYTVEVTDQNGCKDQDTVTVTVSPRPLVSPAIAAYPTCGDKSGKIVLQKSTENSYSNYSYQWFNQNNQAIAGATSNTIDHIGPGVYKVIVTHPQGCDSLWTISLNPNNTTVTASSGVVDCSLNGANLTVSISGGAPPYALKLFREDNNLEYMSLPSQDETTWNLPAVEEGVYYATITDVNKCVYSSNNIQVQPAPQKPVVPDLGPDKFTCGPMIGIEVSPVPTDAYTYSWASYVNGSTVNAIASGQGTPSIIGQNPSNPSSSIVDYVLTVTNGSCIKKDTIRVTYSTFEVALPEDVAQCSDQGSYVIKPSFTPTASTAQAKNFSYKWEKIDAPTKVFTTRSSTLSVNASGTYQVTVVNNTTGCSASDIQKININEAPIDKLGPDLINIYCKGETVQLDAGYPDGSLLWTGPGVPPGTNTRILKVTEEGQYIATINSNGCTASFDIVLKFKPAPESGLTEDSVQFCSQRQKSITLTAGRNLLNLSYRWFDASGTQIGTENRVTVTKGGSYFVEINNPSIECVTRDTIKVKDECETHVFIPNAFSPNGDSKNDVLEFKGEPVAFFDVKIFNRWGQLIFQSNDKEIGWNGRTNENKDAPSGTYVYTLVYRSLKGDQNKKFTQKGSVVLIR